MRRSGDPAWHRDEHRAATGAPLLGYRREVSEDGVIGSERVVALALAVHSRSTPRPMIW